MPEHKFIIRVSYVPPGADAQVTKVRNSFSVPTSETREELLKKVTTLLPQRMNLALEEAEETLIPKMLSAQAELTVKPLPEQEKEVDLKETSTKIEVGGVVEESE